jgi:hypothetical protein
MVLKLTWSAGGGGVGAGAEESGNHERRGGDHADSA